MRREEDRGIPIHARQGAEEILAGCRIEAGRRLVQQEDGSMRGKCEAEIGLLERPARQGPEWQLARLDQRQAQLP